MDRKSISWGLHVNVGKLKQKQIVSCVNMDSENGLIDVSVNEVGSYGVDVDVGGNGSGYGSE